MVSNNEIDAVISDNRPGLYHPAIPSVYITHQLTIQTNNRILNRLIQKFHYHFINRFNECWVPDNQHDELAGILSHPEILPAVPVKYTGLLSRFKKKHHKFSHDFLLLISGPEPQRSIFEKLLLKLFDTVDGSFIIVRGLPGNKVNLTLKSLNARSYNHLSSDSLNLIFQQCEMVVARAGYSTIMDVARLHKKAVLVPTPGQTEQEYLGKHLHEKKLFYCLQQEELTLKKMNDLRSLPFKANDTPSEMNAEMITDWLQSFSRK